MLKSEKEKTRGDHIKYTPKIIPIIFKKKKKKKKKKNIFLFYFKKTYQ